MNKIKIPKNWEFKYFEVDGNTTKFVYEDQLGIEHIYINKEPELPTYEELQKRLDFMIEQNDKKQQVLDKIKERIKTYPHISYASVEKIDGKRLSGQLIPVTEILELLEEIE